MTTIVVGADGSEGSDAAMRWCADHARALDARVVVVHAVPPIVSVVPSTLVSPVVYLPDAEELHRDLRAALDVWCAPLREAHVQYDALVIDGQPAETLMQVAAHEGADLVVVGRRGRGGFAEMLLGSVPHTLSHHCAVPLVVVPSTSAE